MEPIFHTLSFIARKERNKILEFLSEVEQTKEVERITDILQIPTWKQSYITKDDRLIIDELIRSKGKSSNIGVDEAKLDEIMAKIKEADFNLNDAVLNTLTEIYDQMSKE